MPSLSHKVASSNRIRPPRPKWNRNQKFSNGTVGLTAFLFLIFGIWIGSQQHGHVQSFTQPQKTVTVTATKTVTVPQKIPFVPESCKSAADLLNQVLPLLNQVLAEPNLQSDIITQVKAAITSQDSQALSRATTRENTEHNNMANVQQELMDTWTRYSADQARCLKEIGK